MSLILESVPLYGIETTLVDLRGKMDPHKARVVYVLQCQESYRFKIGISSMTNAVARIDHLIRTAPTELAEVAAFLSDGNSLETFLHRKFKHLRLRGEWFEASVEIRDFIEKLKADQPKLEAA